jgi:hypothetical protein
MGWAEDLPLTALAAFRRHGFARTTPTGPSDASWLPSTITTGRGGPWRVSGSLLGLDDTLAPVALRRPTLRPLGAAPRLNTGDRRWLVATVAALDRAAFTDQAQAEAVALLARGRATLAAARTPAAARDAVARAGGSPLRQTLAAWLAEVNPDGVPGVLSVTEIMRLGADAAPPAALEAWGNAQGPISGRLAAGPLPAWSWERYAGRSTRLVACALPDLQIVLATRLAAMELPAVLVPDLMPSAIFELVNMAPSRYADDFDTLAEWVQRLDAGAVERYLGLLTTNGPLRAEPGARPR